ncbi:autophagy protein 16-domain-containing protein [Pterulicium gracile]|uniref:Autophagy protein 16-domain-containing protein n=1 Tax=Pterulicium gracile TaxID=1884261 RepID=A0A5C3QCD1_9AGAR|nr:autophagy protein 16-domain-containing protein [Pterula gracilis]
MTDPVWQETLRLRLLERNARESAFASIIDQYRRLAQQTKLLKERNSSLLRAVSSVRSNPSSSTVFVPGTSEENPVRAAYTASLESQISALNDEIATVYKTQSQNAQRLLSMNETLREKEEQSRIEVDGLRKARDEISVLQRKVDQHSELMSEKARTVQILHDEISTLQLELGQIEDRNSTLQKDNAKLLQRWLDAKQAEANKMNEANQFYETLRSQHDNVLSWRDDATPGVGPNSLGLGFSGTPGSPMVMGQGALGSPSPHANGPGTMLGLGMGMGGMRSGSVSQASSVSGNELEESTILSREKDGVLSAATSDPTAKTPNG